jgi:hypothetical protein
MQNVALRNGISGEGIRATAKRLRNDPAYFNAKHTFDRLLMSTTEADENDDIDMGLMSTKELVRLKKSSRVMVSNGGTLDITPVTSTSANAAGSVFYDSGAAARTNIVTSGFTAFVNVSGANAVGSVWWKGQLSHNQVAVGFYYNGTNALAVDPTIRITVPSGVPSGRLVVKGNLHSVSSLYVANAGAGANLSEISGMSLTGSTIEVSDSSGSYWTWDTEQNEGYRYQRRISKGTNTATTTDVQLTFTGGAVAGYCVAVLEVHYKLDNVMLQDLDSMNVDIDAADPISRHLDVVQAYNEYLNDAGMDDFMTILNARLSTNYDSDILYPTNWNTASFENFNRFIDEYVLLMQNFYDQIKTNHEFLSN